MALKFKNELNKLEKLTEEKRKALRDKQNLLFIHNQRQLC